MHWLGILLAFGALIGWGFGDFFIQRAARAIGTWPALLWLSAIGSVVLLPFAWPAFAAVAAQPGQWRWLALSALIACLSAPVNFAALRRGKIAVVSPIIALELPLTVALSIAIGREQISPVQVALILATFTGIVLTSATTATRLERGAALAFISAFGLGASNFLIGKNSQELTPALALWVTYTALAIESLLVISLQKKMHLLAAQAKHYWRIIAAQSLADVPAWASYALATTLIPIAVTITISESYVALSVLLGLTVNRETLTLRQRLGAVIAVSGVVTLAAVTGT